MNCQYTEKLSESRGTQGIGALEKNPGWKGILEQVQIVP